MTSTAVRPIVLVCTRHHTLIHRLGFALVLDGDRKLSVTMPEGALRLHHPGLPWRDPTELDPDSGIDADTLPPDHVVARVDLDYAVMVMMLQSA